MRWLLLIFLLLALSGCKLWGSAAGGGDMVYDHRCKVQVDSASAIANSKDGSTTLDVSVNPDCSVVIKGRRVLADDVRNIEDGQRGQPDETP